MHQKKDMLAGIIELESHKRLRGVDKEGLLNLL